MTSELNWPDSQGEELFSLILKSEGLDDFKLPVIQPRKRAATPRASFAQQRLWFLDQLDPGSAVYHIAFCFRLQGPLNIPALQKTIDELVRRHESLRTTFELVDGQLLQRIAVDVPSELRVTDLVDEGQERAREVVTAEARRPFDLTKGPLLRADLFRLAEQEHILLLVMHHIISDGWSGRILNQELGAVYRALVEKRTWSIPELPIQYADYSEWQRDWLQGDVLDKQIAYWEQQLAGSLPALDLPTDRQRPAVQSTHGGMLSFELDARVVNGLKQLCQQERVTLYMALMAAFQVLLSRYTGEVDIVVGTPIANRNRPELEGLVGFFVNTMVIRTDLSGNPPFKQALQRVRETALGAFEYQDIPLEKLVEVLRPDRSTSRAPLFQVMFALESDAPGIPDMPGLQVELIPVDTRTAKFELTLSCTEAAGKLAGYFEYNADLFDAASIERMIGHFKTLLESIVAHPEHRIGELSLLTERERRQILDEWNNTAAPYPRDRCIHQLFEEQVERTPDAAAVEFEGATLSYCELNTRANRVAHRLNRMGVGPEVLVGLCVDRSFDLIVGLLAILKAGGAYLPLDPRYPRERIAYMLGDARAPVLVTEHGLRGLLAGYQGQMLELDTAWEELTSESPQNPASGVQPQNLAYVVYTSGSTGRPKGVMVEHGGLVNVAMRKQDVYKIKPGQRVLQFSSICFDASASELLLAFPVGARLCLIRYQDDFSQVGLLGAEAAILPPSALDILDPAVCSNLKLLVSAGERCEAQQLKRWMDGRRIFNAYGPTETTIWSSVFPAENSDAAPPIGKPIGNVQLYVLDRARQPVPVGVAGELYIGGVGVSRGYLNQPSVTATRFVPDPFKHPGGRLYRTGDLVRWRADGNLQFLGRFDHQVKLRGFRIELGEIEKVLQEHPAVNSCVVIMREDTAGDRRLVAYIVTREEHKPAVADLRAFLSTRLPDYMVPAAWVFMQALPLNPNLKLDRAALPVPEADRQGLAQPLVAPRDEIEEVLAEIWADVLRIEQIGIHDNFFDLGGHSLLAARLILKTREIFKVMLPLRSLFQAATIAEQAQSIRTMLGQLAELPSQPSLPLDLEAEAVLDAAIQPQRRARAVNSQPERILLTGATGFVGAFILRELLQRTDADVYCLVRARDPEQGRRRIQEHLTALELVQPKLLSRIIPVLGDLAEPELGLSRELYHTLAEQMDLIYHCGAVVNFAYPYNQCKPVNVLGTQDILRLASCHSIPVAHISTLSVLNSPSYTSDWPILEADELRHDSELQGGYPQSKWVAEKLVMAARERGLPVSIFRLGMVAGDSQTGGWGLQDYLPQLVKGCVELGSIPSQDKAWNIAPADFVSRAIVEISLHPGAWGQVFHLFAPRSVNQQEIARWLERLGYSLRPIPLPQWVSELIAQATATGNQGLYSLLSVFQEEESLSLEQQYDDRNVQSELINTGLACPEIDLDKFSRYIGYFVRRGFIPAASAGST